MTTRKITALISAMLFVVLFTQCDKNDNTEETVNNKPTASFIIDPTSGGLQTVFTFDASNSFDEETTQESLQVRWDFNGDGNWDTDYSEDKTVTYQYDATGTYEAKLLVKDTEGQTDETSKSLTVSAGAPTAAFIVSPASGNTETMFEFDASGSSDDNTPLTDLQVRWDFDGNGSWDTDYSTSKIASHQYTNAGTYVAMLEVQDDDNLSSTASANISVENAPPEGCPPILEDPRDGKEYATLEIGEQCWMAENLNIGDRINGNQTPSDNGSIEKYCYDDEESNCDTYGGLYMWNELMQYTSTEGAQGICPDGWHVPTDAEWMMLEVEIGMSYEDATSTGLRGTDEGAKLRVGGSSGFEAMLAGYRNSGGDFSSLDGYATFFTSSPSSNLAWSRYLFNNMDQVMRNKYDKSMSYSLRCLKDE
ncbi:MAG: FISUMP domain-containing protein [Bacteroidota bacterium]|nr:FISUMP domain-containing protein [Bacteroidota bacterium]